VSFPSRSAARAASRSSTGTCSVSPVHEPERRSCRGGAAQFLTAGGGARMAVADRGIKGDHVAGPRVLGRLRDREPDDAEDRCSRITTRGRPVTGPGSELPKIPDNPGGTSDGEDHRGEDRRSAGPPDVSRRCPDQRDPAVSSPTGCGTGSPSRCIVTLPTPATSTPPVSSPICSTCGATWTGSFSYCATGPTPATSPPPVSWPTCSPGAGRGPPRGLPPQPGHVAEQPVAPPGRQRRPDRAAAVSACRASLTLSTRTSSMACGSSTDRAASVIDWMSRSFSSTGGAAGISFSRNSPHRLSPKPGSETGSAALSAQASPSACDGSAPPIIS
jgi:hypothetical protein